MREGYAPLLHPVEFIIDEHGKWHFAQETLPLRTIWNGENMPVASPELRELVEINQKDGTVTLSLDGRTVVYDRTAYTLGGLWICDLRIGQKRGIEG